MKKNLSPHSFIKDKLNTWKHKLMETTVEKQNQPETRVLRDIYSLIIGGTTPLRLKSVMMIQKNLI